MCRLDFGCGAGVISEHISDQTGTVVTGIDYAKTVIAAAAEAGAKLRPQRAEARQRIPGIRPSEE